MGLALMSFLGWHGFGLVGNIVIGILGALIGVTLPRLGIFPVSTAANFVAATLGAVILLVLLRVVRRR